MATKRKTAVVRGGELYKFMFGVFPAPDQQYAIQKWSRMGALMLRKEATIRRLKNQIEQLEEEIERSRY